MVVSIKINIIVRHPPVAALPNFLCIPDLVVGIPVFFAILRLTFVMPKALFGEKDKPGIPVFVPRFFAMTNTSLKPKLKISK